MIRKIAIGTVALLAACGAEEQPERVIPEDGQVVSTRCIGYERRAVLTDGEGGYRMVVAGRSPECGWDPEPRGKLYEEACEAPHTLVSTYHDGGYGYYEERTPESEQCGFIPEELEVAVNDEFGDRFKPAVLKVFYEVRGEPAEWEYDAGDLRAEKVGDELHVYGNGEEFQQEVLINDEPFMVQFSPEPRCATQEASVDCLGYRYSGRMDGLIYYGEEDDQIVTIDLVLLIVAASCEITPADRALTCDDEVDRSKYQRRVDRYNDAMERSGVFLRFNLKDVRLTTSWGLNTGRSVIGALNGDIGLGIGAACPGSCGCAHPNTRYVNPGYGISMCGWKTDLHELGHVVGLAHGPENRGFAARGYLFSEFGHGWNSTPCNREGDIMSYNYSSYVFFNSALKCAEVWSKSDDVETAVTDRSYADSAYHWNRIRYDLSLIYDEHNEGTVLALKEIEIDDDLTVILD
jgi:hypothetical protein